MYFRRDIESDLHPDKLYTLLWEYINENPEHNFRPFSWASYFKFIKKDETKRSFILCSTGWDRMNAVKGKIIVKDGKAIIILRMFPRLWFYILFVFVPLVILYLAETGYFIISALFWLSVIVLSTGYQILAFASICRSLKAAVISMDSIKV